MTSVLSHFLCDISDKIAQESAQVFLPLCQMHCTYKQGCEVFDLALMILRVETGVIGSVSLFQMWQNFNIVWAAWWSKKGFWHRLYHDCFKVSLHKYLFRWGILRDEGDLKVGAYQLPPKVILAAFSADAFPHKVNLINYYLPWWQTSERHTKKKHTSLKPTVQGRIRKVKTTKGKRKRKWSIGLTLTFRTFCKEFTSILLPD